MAEDADDTNEEPKHESTTNETFSGLMIDVSGRRSSILSCLILKVSDQVISSRLRYHFILLSLHQSLPVLEGASR